VKELVEDGRLPALEHSPLDETGLECVRPDRTQTDPRESQQRGNQPEAVRVNVDGNITLCHLARLATMRFVVCFREDDLPGISAGLVHTDSTISCKVEKKNVHLLGEDLLILLLIFDETKGMISGDGPNLRFRVELSILTKNVHRSTRDFPSEVVVVRVTGLNHRRVHR
jgi:hypothetical protein